ncbi:MAG: sigma-70 family RNA polymerase sigma factor [Caldilineaceae bacterium]
MAEQQLILETDLIRQAQNGNSAAYGELYTRHLAAIQRYIQQRVGERSEAEDLTQTVFVKAWQALRDYQPTGAPFRAWLYRIAHNAVIDHYRTQRKPLCWDELTGLVDPQATPELCLLTTERQEVVRMAIAGLRPTYQAVLIRRFLQNQDYSETAAELGQQVNHVRVIQHRALEALRRVLTEQSALWLATTVTVLSLVLGGKIVVAAEGALPGDRLYPMRTWVEETTLLLADDVTDIQLHTRFATQRITALETLYQQGRTTDLTTAVVAAADHVHAAAAKFTVVAQADAVDRTALTSDFATALHAQTDALHTLTRMAPQTAPTLQPVFIALTAAEALLPANDVGVSSPAPVATPTATPGTLLGATPTRVLLPTPTPAVNPAGPLSAAMTTAADRGTADPTAQPPVQLSVGEEPAEPLLANAESAAQPIAPHPQPHSSVVDPVAVQSTVSLSTTHAVARPAPESLFAAPHTANHALAVEQAFPDGAPAWPDQDLAKHTDQPEAAAPAHHHETTAPQQQQTSDNKPSSLVPQEEVHPHPDKGEPVHRTQRNNASQQ